MGEQEQVLTFWFPDDAGSDLATHEQFWKWRMRGGADETIVAQFSNLTERGAKGELDAWAETSEGRLALIVVLDQFSRSVFRGSPRSFAQDPRALALALQGFDNGHYDALATVWEKAFYQMPLGHCEGPGHLARLDRSIEISRALLAEAPEYLRPLYEFSAEQPVLHRKVIAAFGRHPHRNELLGRASTPGEVEYLERGELPHLRDLNLS